MTQMIPCALVFLLAAAAIASPATAQTRKQLDWCANKDDAFAPMLRIEGCTAAINAGDKSGENLSWAYYNRGIAYTKKDQLDRAIADFDQALRLDPDSMFALNNRGAAYARKGQYDRAISDFSEAIRLDPESATAFNNRGTAYAKLGQYERAIEDFDQAIRIDPKDMSALNNRRLAKQLIASNGAAPAPTAPSPAAKIAPSPVVQVAAPPAPAPQPAASNIVRATEKSITSPKVSNEPARNVAGEPPPLPKAGIASVDPIVNSPGNFTPPPPVRDLGNTTLNAHQAVKKAKGLGRRHAKFAAPARSHRATAARSTYVHHAAARPHRAKSQSLLARIFRKPFNDLRKVFRVAQRKPS